MITISCYTFHPLIQQFVRLYRRVQVVADWLTCILSVFCCQCLPPLPPSTPTSYSSPSLNRRSSVPVIMDARPAIDPDRAGSGEPLRAQCVSIDFTPQQQDTDETATRCNQYIELLRSQPNLEGIMVTSEKSPYVNEDESVPVHKRESMPVPNKLSGRNTLLPLSSCCTAVHYSQHKA